MDNIDLTFKAETALFQCLSSRLDLIRRIYTGRFLKTEISALFEIASHFPSVLEQFNIYYHETF